MSRGALVVALFMVTVAAVPAAHAADVTTYGAGLQSCKAYLDSRETDRTTDRVAFVDWLSGYVSGVNNTSPHRNNFLGLSDLSEALRRIDGFCEARPRAQFAEAAGMLVFGAKTGPAAHALEVTTYGSADKSCGLYLQAREQRDPINGAEFRDWLGGYLSGVNAMSLRTSNVLGKTPLIDAVRWLDGWCSAHPVTAFGAAVEELVTASQLTQIEIAAASSSSSSKSTR